MASRVCPVGNSPPRAGNRLPAIVVACPVRDTSWPAATRVCESHEVGRSRESRPRAVGPSTITTSWVAPSSSSGIARASTVAPSSTAERTPRYWPSGFCTAIQQIRKRRLRPLDHRREHGFLSHVRIEEQRRVRKEPRNGVETAECDQRLVKHRAQLRRPVDPRPRRKRRRHECTHVLPTHRHRLVPPLEPPLHRPRQS